MKKLVGKAAEVPASEVEEIIEELQTLDSKPDLLEIVKEADKFASNRLMGGETWGYIHSNPYILKIANLTGSFA